MAEEKNKGGRPSLTEDEKKIMLQKLEPYLKSGLSTRKALLQAGVPNSTFYDLMEKDEKFREQINIYRQFVPIMLNSSMVKHLQEIIAKQNDGEKLNKEDLKFLKWFAINSNITKEEFGERKEIGIYDPEVEIQRLSRLIDEQSKGEDNDSS